MNKHANYNLDRLKTARGSQDRARLLGWGVLALAVLILLAMALALFDHRWMLSQTTRALGFVCLSAVFLAGLTGLWMLAWNRSNLKQAALELERERTELGCTVSTAAEYLAGKKPRQEYEPQFVEALQETAAKRLMVVQISWVRKLLAPFCLLGGALFLFLLFLALLPFPFKAMERVLFPWSGAAYTSIVIDSAPPEIPEGSALIVKGAFAGRIPKLARVEWRLDGSPWSALAVEPDQNGRFSHTFEQVLNAFQYRVIGGDAVSDAYQVQTFTSPAIEELRLRVSYPEYTGLPPLKTGNPNLSLLRGSRIEFNIQAAGQIANGTIQFASLPEIELAPATPVLWTAQAQATEDSYYWIELSDLSGRTTRNPEPYRLTILPDEPPKVRIDEPGEDIRADANDTVQLRIAATDDFGLSQIRLFYRKMNSSEEVIECEPNFSNPREATAIVEIDLGPLDLQPYEVVAYYAVAEDNNTLDGPGRGQSPVYFIEVTHRERPLAQCYGQARRINLLQIQKQIIAATAAIEAGRQEEQMRDLAAIQRQAITYAELFKNSFLLSISPLEAHQEFEGALRAMQSAAIELEHFRQTPALAAEEKALAHLYQVVRLLPELEAGMCRGEGDKVVLEAIEEYKEIEDRRREAELAELLAMAKSLARSQSELARRYSQWTSPGRSGLASEADSIRPGNDGTDPSEKENDQGITSGDDEQKEGLAGAGEEQKSLASQADALSARLEELSRRDARVASRFAFRLREVARSWQEAAHHANQTAPSEAYSYGRQGLMVLAKVIEGLEQILSGETLATDIALEDIPKEYESMVSQYLKKLSYAE